MKINERVSPKRLAEIIARAEVCDDSVLTDYRDIESIARELQQYRAAAELEVSDDELNAALTVHRLKTDGHSQLSDAFRAGYKYARRAAPQVTSVPEEATPESIEVLASVRPPHGVAFQLDGYERKLASDIWNACRGAMLTGEGETAAPPVQAEQLSGNSPVIPDGWLAEAERLAELHGASFVIFRHGQAPVCADPSKFWFGYDPAAPKQEAE